MALSQGEKGWEMCAGSCYPRGSFVPSLGHLSLVGSNWGRGQVWDAPVLPRALDAEPRCWQSCARLPPALSRSWLDQAENARLNTKPKTIPKCSHPQKQEEPGTEAGALGSASQQAGVEGCRELSPTQEPCKPSANILLQLLQGDRERERCDLTLH